MLDEVKREHANHIFVKGLRAFVLFQPVKSVGVVGDGRCSVRGVPPRAVETIDFMVARWAHLPYELLETVCGHIINAIDGISRVTLRRVEQAASGPS